MKAIDTHAHLLMPELQEAVAKRAPEQVAAASALELKRHGQESIKVSGRMIGERWLKLTDRQERLRSMQETGVTHQWVSPSPSHFYPWADKELAVWVYQEAHRIMAQHVAGASEQLTGMGLVPLQHPELCVDALDDAVLNHGFIGIEISSFADEVELSDERLDPLWARAAELGAIIFLHPFGCSLDERLDRYYLANSVGQPIENAVAISHLIFGGVFDRHPSLKVIAAHGGGYLHAGIGRADRAWAVRPEAAGCIHPPSQYLSKLYYDTVVHSELALKQLIESVGTDRIVLGSDFPFDMGLDNPVVELREGLQNIGFSSQVEQSILYQNAADLRADKTHAIQGGVS